MDWYFVGADFGLERIPLGTPRMNGKSKNNGHG
jgi:hypothetical protein